jgi:hypothetical protein
MGKIQKMGTNIPQYPPIHEHSPQNDQNVTIKGHICGLKGLEEVCPLIKCANVPKMGEEKVKKGPRTKAFLQPTPKSKEVDKARSNNCQVCDVIPTRVGCPR